MGDRLERQVKNNLAKSLRMLEVKNFPEEENIVEKTS